MGTNSRWLARVPLLAAAAGCAGGILLAEAGAAVGLASIPAAIGLGLLLGRRWKLGSGCAALALFWGVHGERLERQKTAAEWVWQTGRAISEVEGTIVSLRDRGGFLPRALFRVDGSGENPADLRGAVIGVRNLPDVVKPGDRLLLRGPLAVPSAVRNPGEFDRQGWMRSRGLAAEMRAYSHEIVGLPRFRLMLHRLAWELRVELRDRIVAGLDERGEGAALIRGLVLGDRSGGGEELLRAFRESGTMHIFAVSGLHVGLVGLLAWGLTGLLRIPRAWGLWAVLLVMWGYALITGLRPPAMRASLMASVFLVGFAVKRRPSLANSLLASFLPVLLLDSYQLGQAGFQLSYAVVGMIILVAPFLYRRLQRVVEGDPFLPPILYTRRQRWMRDGRKKVAGLFVVSLAAWMGSLPLIGLHFGMVTPVAVLASMLLVPIVFGILSLAMVGVAVGLVAPPLELAANRANGMLATGAHRIAEGFAALPGSHFELRGQSTWRTGMLVLDLRDGDAAIYLGAGEGALVDGGAEDEFRRVVAPAMRSSGASPRSMVLTHPDVGHVGGLDAALEMYRPRQVLLPVLEAGSPSFRSLLDRAPDFGCVATVGVEGARYPIGDGCELEVLRVANRETGSRADDRGMILRVHWHGWRILITGDAGFDTERELLGRGIDVRSDLWIMGRHRSDYSGTIEFVKAVAPRAIVACDARYPLEERIPEWWNEAIGQAGIELWRQAETGAVMLHVSEEALKLRSFLDSRRRLVLER